MAVTRTFYVARRPFGYAGTDLDRGQIFELRGAPNDEKLIRLGYVEVFPAKSTSHECPECGAAFVGINERTAHYKKWHEVHTPFEEDEMEAREENMLLEVAPLNLDKTLAAQGVAQGAA